MNEFKVGRVLVMVVDDQLIGSGGEGGRQGVYEKWFEQVANLHDGKWAFDIRYCGTLNDVAKIVVEPGQPYLAVVDMVLGGEEWTSRCVSRLDEKLIQEEWPLLLLSARFDSEEAIERANRLVGKRTKSVPFQFLPWSSISRAVEGVEWKEVAFIVGALIGHARGQDLRFSKTPEESIEFLHITDPHFGKAKWDAGSLITLRMARKSFGLDCADFLAITGDISNTATPEQYILALEYFVALAGNKLVASVDTGLARDRVFVCPGNHDFSRPLALSANLSDTLPYAVQPTMLGDSSWMRSYAWAPYQEFESRVSENSHSWVVSPGYRINSRFSSSGLIVLELNVERFNIDGYQIGITEDEMRSTVNAAVAAVSGIRKNLECLVVLAHRHESNIWSGLAQMIQSNLQGLASEGPLLFLCGHEHSADVAPGLKDKVLFIRGVPPNDGPSLPKKVLPMVNCVRLLRSSGVVSGVEIFQFSQHSAGWQTDVDGPSRYDYVKGKWRAN